MEANEIRQRFLRFFEEREHAVVPSASLIPVDPTLLLTVAGMVPFKPYLLGEETPPYPRAVSIQKCIRTEDIEVVGTTARHMTYFEMMGNFSFGDYFKEKAIPYAYDLMTEGFELDPDRLWYTVHLTDDEAAEIWVDGVGIPADRLQRRDRDNIWQMGVPGPAGPSSEVFYDRGPGYGPDGGPVVDEERFVEIWNLVFMQNIQDEPYHFVGDLPSKNIDTGAGLERWAMVLQGVENGFETDLMRPVIAAAEGATGKAYGASAATDISLKIMADHGRAVTMMMSDRVVPSNEGRGYILRRLLRRAVRHASVLGADQLVMPELIAATVDVLGEAYPELVEKRSALTDMAVREEEQFRRTLASGHQLLGQELETLGPGEIFSGATAFKLHDTYGFPRELTEEILNEKGIAMDLEEFERMMEEQRERARKAHKGGEMAEAAEVYLSVLTDVGSTDFTGYEHESASGRILAIVREGDLVERADEGQEVELFLDRSPFYAESGGQIGDAGTVLTETGKVRVADTQYALPGIHGHQGVVTAGSIRVSQDAKAEIVASRRERIRKNHTGTHVLHHALRSVVGDHVHQAGSLVAPDKLRFDFSHHAALTPDELADVERLVNERIIANGVVSTLETTKEEAEKMGALAFFGDKYGEQVRVVKIGDYSMEFCGGTHVHTSGQIGPLVMVSEGSVAANTRRVEAVTGGAGYEYLVGLRRQLDELGSTLRAQPGQLVEAARSLTTKVKDQEERLAAFADQARSSVTEDLANRAETTNGKSVLVVGVEGAAADELRALALQLRDRLKPALVVVGSQSGGKGSLVAAVSGELLEAGVSAAEVIRGAADVLGGGGSRDPELAQAGGPNGDRIEEALEEARRAARAAVAGS